MPNELEAIGVTRPTSFDPAKDYAYPIARGDEWLGDYDVNDLAEIMRYDMAALSRLLFVEGAVLFESGGSIAPPIAGSALGGDILVSAGVYLGIIESQLYTVQIVTPGLVGFATYTWRSTGSDNPHLAGTPVPITIIAPSVAAVASEPEKYLHAVGTLGVQVAFVNPAGTVNPSNWVVLATYGARAPLVTKGSPDAGHDTIRCYDIVTVVQGAPRRVRDTTFTVAAATTGLTVIYGEWTRRIVTHHEDADLVDPASDTPQASRMQWRMVYRIMNTSDLALGTNEVERRVYPLYTWARATNRVTKIVERPYAINLELTQGAMSADRLRNIKQSVLLQGEFARRDRGAHGNYVVSPRAPSARATLSTNAAPPGKIRLAIAPSVVSVEGIEITHSDPVEIEVDEATEFGSVAGEQHPYDASLGAFYLTKSTGERVFPIRAEIPLCRGHVQIGVGPVASGSGYEPRTGATDVVLANTGVVEIVHVASAIGGTEYFVGAGALQWQLVGDALHWETSFPVGTFVVSYRYNRLMTQNVDFTLTWDGQIAFAPPLGPSGGVDPVDGGIVTIDYTFSLPRVDAIIVRPSGDYLVVRGVAAEAPFVPALPPLSCEYVRVELEAGSGASVRLVPYDNDAVYMTTLNRLVRAADESARNDLYQDLFNQMRSETTANMIDIVAEAFASLDVADVTYSRLDAASVMTAFDALIDVDAVELTLPFTQATYLPTRTTSGLPTGETAVRVGADFYTLPYTDVVAIQNDAYSKTYPINPYADYTPEDPSFTVTPDQDFFVDTTNQTITTIVQIRKTQATRQGLISRQELARLTREFRARNGRAPRTLELIGFMNPTVIGQDVQTLAGVYMRSITLTVRGLHCVPGEKIRAKFDGKDVALTAVAPTTQGTGGDAPAVICTANTIVVGDITELGGAMQATFPVPANVPVGTRMLVIYGNLAASGATWNSADPASGGYAVRGMMPFTSDGIVRNTVTEERVLGIIKEPIAQSVIFPESRMITKVEVPFATKAASGGPPVIFEIRGTDRSGQASTPIDQVLASISRDALKISTPDDERPAGPDIPIAGINTFQPGDPILCFPSQFRALVFRSASDAYQIYVAALGEPNLASGGIIQAQAIRDGIFLDSANNVDWTLRQGWDLRCTVYVAQMTTLTAFAYLSRVTHTDITGFTLNVDQVLPDGTSIDWDYSVDSASLVTGGKVWRRFVPFVTVEVPALPDGSIGDALDIRATLRSTSLFVTPAFHQRNLSVHVTTNVTTATYVSKLKILSEDATAVAGAVEILDAPGGSHELAVSIDDGAHWFLPVLTTPSGYVSPDGFTRYQFVCNTWTGSTSLRKLRLRLVLTTPSKALRPRAHALGAYAAPV